MVVNSEIVDADSEFEATENYRRYHPVDYNNTVAAHLVEENKNPRGLHPRGF